MQNAKNASNEFLAAHKKYEKADGLIKEYDMLNATLTRDLESKTSKQVNKWLKFLIVGFFVKLPSLDTNAKTQKAADLSNLLIKHGYETIDQARQERQEAIDAKRELKSKATMADPSTFQKMEEGQKKATEGIRKLSSEVDELERAIKKVEEGISNDEELKGHREERDQLEASLKKTSASLSQLGQELRNLGIYAKHLAVIAKHTTPVVGAESEILAIRGEEFIQKLKNAANNYSKFLDEDKKAFSIEDQKIAGDVLELFNQSRTSYYNLEGSFGAIKAAESVLYEMKKSLDQS